MTPYIYKFAVNDTQRDDRMRYLVHILETWTHITKIDINKEKKLIRIITSEPLDVETLKHNMKKEGFILSSTDKDAQPRSHLQNGQRTSTSNELRLCVQGMHCRSCEITIERKFKKLEGVKKVFVNSAKGTAKIIFDGRQPEIHQLQSLIEEDGYTITTDEKIQNVTSERPSALQLVGIFTLVILIGIMFSKLGLLKLNVAIGASISLGAVFVLGLVAASSSCIAVAGGLLLSSAAKFNEAFQSKTSWGKMKPVVLFVAGRIFAYALLGGVIGYLGEALSPSPAITGTITVLAALYMLIMGLDMLHIAPRWMKKLMPRMPKKLSHKIMDAEHTVHPLAPFLLGGATFFLPCGFTQSLQLYALTTGNAVTSALLLGTFALGTAPALLILGWASSSLKGKFGKFFFRFAGALVIMLGLWNIQNGLTITGHPLSLPSFRVNQQAVATNNANVTYDGKTQTVTMSVASSGYTPSQFTLQQGVPTKWVIDAKELGGCISVLTSSKLGINKLLALGKNVIEFTPQQTGAIPFSCSMGMYRGQFNVVPKS